MIVGQYLVEYKIKMYASSKELNESGNINPCDINQSHVALPPFLIMAMVIKIRKKNM
jgi:hypothetical protein